MRAKVGGGSLSGPPQQPDAAANAAAKSFDFTRSIPPLPAMVAPHLASALTRLAVEGDPADLVHSAGPGGSEADRRAGATWLAPRFGAPVPVDRVIVTGGTQNALFVLLEALVGRDGLILAEDLSWGVIVDLAQRAHVRLKGVPIDEDGIIPEAFEAACRIDRPRALYCNPTDQNPTTAIMPRSRRLALAEIARRHGVPIIEDDAIGRLHPGAPPPIAAVAPDIVWYVMGLTKCIAHGLRLAYVVGPSAAAIATLFRDTWRLSFWYPTPLAAAVASDWIENGAADEICAAIRRESVARMGVADDLLAGADIVTKPGGMHLWLRLPQDTDRHGFARHLRQKGVLVRLSDQFAVGLAPPPNAVRISLSAPRDRVQIAEGLAIIAATLGLNGTKAMAGELSRCHAGKRP